MESDESGVEHAFAEYLASLGARADELRREASRTLERGARQARDLGWSQRRIARSLGRSQPEVRRLLGREVGTDHHDRGEVGHGSVLDLVLRQHRDEVVEVAARHGVRNVRVFGSVASGNDRPDSDVDLLVDVDDGVGLFALGRLETELTGILGRPVDVVPERSLRSAVGDTVVAIPL